MPIEIFSAYFRLFQWKESLLILNESGYKYWSRLKRNSKSICLSCSFYASRMLSEFQIEFILFSGSLSYSKDPGPILIL